MQFLQINMQFLQPKMQFLQRWMQILQIMMPFLQMNLRSSISIEIIERVWVRIRLQVKYD